MFAKFDAERVKTYLFGVAIGCAVVATVLLVKAQMSARELAAADEAAANAALTARPPAPDSSPK